MGTTKIRWRTSDFTELRRTVRNFDQQRRREIARNPAAEKYLPPPMSLRELKKQITTRAEYNREVKLMREFAKPEMRKPVKTATGNKSAWEIKAVKQKIKIVNRKNKIIYDKMMATGVYSDGRPTGMKRAEMGTARLHDFKPLKFDVNKTMTDWKKFVRHVDMKSFAVYDAKREKLFQENYKKHIENLFWEERFEKDRNKILKMISGMDSFQFETAINTFEDLTIGGTWDSDQEFTDEDLDNMMESYLDDWKSAAKMIKEEG